MAMSFLPNRLHHHPTHVLPNPPQILRPRLSFFSIALGRYNNSIRDKIPPRQSRLKMLQIAASSLSGIESSGFPSEDITVFDLNGNEIPISDLWKDRKAVVAFARHFGCVLCRKRADYLASKKDVMDASGVSLVLVGPGSIDQAKAFYEQTKFEGEIYADPSHASYRALRFVSGVSTTFTPEKKSKQWPGRRNQSNRSQGREWRPRLDLGVAILWFEARTVAPSLAVKNATRMCQWLL